MSEVTLKKESVVSGLERAEVVAVGDWFDRAVDGFDVDGGEGNEAVAVDDQWSPGIDDNLFSGSGDEFDIGEPAAFIVLSDNDGGRGRGGNANRLVVGRERCGC